MSCQATTSQNMSEFEFFQALRDRKDACCGPITQIGFTQQSMAAMVLALIRSGAGMDYLDNFDHQMLDSSHLSLIICSKHWIELIKLVGTAGTDYNNELWIEVSFYIFRVLCLSNSWDHRELINYLKTLGMINQSKPY